MIFSSLSFLFLFFPITFIIYAVIPKIKFRNAVLIIASLVFYAWGEPVYVLLLLASVLLNWLLTLVMVKRERLGKPALISAVIINIGLLIVFKYSGFLIDSINKIFSLSVPVPAIRLPIGISFFTFQILSYVIDVYRKDCDAQKNFFELLLYISLFPQLIAGPIVQYHDIKPQLENRSLSLEKSADGWKRFLFGLPKKVLIADSMAASADYAFGLSGSSLTAFAAWLGAISYMLQIYFDFSGYSDMAIGLGKIFGFDFKENFRYPYASLGIKDFWRRWHISLSTWFRNYLYIPLGGNRKGRFRTFLNQMTVFACTGLWHGANVTFLAWGIYHGTFLVLESSGIIPVGKLEKHTALRPIVRIYTVFAVLIGFVLFRADSISQAVQFISTMFTGGCGSAADAAKALTFLTPRFIFIALIALVLSFPVVPALRSRLTSNRIMSGVWNVCGCAVSVILFLLCILTVVSSTNEPFIYFRF